MNGIELRKNPPYTPQYNGKIERYHNENGALILQQNKVRQRLVPFWNIRRDK